MELTPQQLHYFKRELISLQLTKELEAIKKNTELSTLIDSTNASKEYPFLRYLTKNFILEFPLLKEGENNKDFWIKLQSFLDEYSKLKLDVYAPTSSQDSQRRVLLYKVQKLLIISLAASIKTVQGQEESINILKSQVNEDKEQEALVNKLNMAKLESEEHDLESVGLNGLKLNIVTVRDVSEVRTIRQHLHSEFILQTHLITTEGEQPAVFVARRHGQFRQLRDDLKAAFPTLELPGIPSKAHDSNTKEHLHREKDRIMLRAFLKQLASEPVVADSVILKYFLLQNPIQLNEQEQKDAQVRQLMDSRRVEEEKRFREQVDKKIVELDGLLDMLKTQMMKPNGLVEIFQIIKNTDKIDQLPIQLQKAIEWGRINFAFVLHTQFVTSDKSVENIANLKRTHGLIPYRTIAQILKLSNPFAMVKGVLDLFLAQPLGSRSLFQRIMLANMSEQKKELQKDIEELQIKINDPLLCEKLMNAVKTDKPDNVTLGQSPISETLQLLKDPSIAPILTPEQILKVAFANQPGKVESRLLVEQLYHLWILYARKQEQDVLMTLVFQGVTGEIIKDLFAIFYEPLAQVYKAANIGDTIGHISNFITDLISIVDKLDAEDATNTAQPFIDLVQRHEGEFYQFVHSVHAQDKSKLFDNLLGYVDHLFSFVSTGIEQKIDLIEITKEAQVNDEAGLKQEIGQLIAYHTLRKQRHLERKRQKLASASNDLQGSEEIFDFLPQNQQVMGVFSDMADMDSEDDETYEITADTSMQHEMTIPEPTLILIPKIVPIFVSHVEHIMQ